MKTISNVFTHGVEKTMKPKEEDKEYCILLSLTDEVDGHFFTDTFRKIKGRLNAYKFVIEMTKGIPSGETDEDDEDILIELTNREIDDILQASTILVKGEDNKWIEGPLYSFLVKCGDLYPDEKFDPDSFGEEAESEDEYDINSSSEVSGEELINMIGGKF